MNTKLLIVDWNRTLYDPERETLFEGVSQILQSLSSRGVDLLLLSKGDEARLAEIETHIAPELFIRIIATPTKTPELLSSLNAKGQYEKVYLVGDRIKSEIRCANLVGYESIWFRNGKFKDETPDSSEENPDHVITSLGELLNLVL